VSPGRASGLAQTRLTPNTVSSRLRSWMKWEPDLDRFLGWLRSGDEPALASIERRPARFSEGTVALRLQAVCSFYRYQHFNGVGAASRL
jgi:hypothetical protein